MNLVEFKDFVFVNRRCLAVRNFLDTRTDEQKIPTRDSSAGGPNFAVRAPFADRTSIKFYSAVTIQALIHPAGSVNFLMF